MSVVIKRSERPKHLRGECPYGCCTVLFGKNVKRIRRAIKRASKQAWRREVR